MAKYLTIEEAIFYTIFGSDCKKTPQEVAGDSGMKYNTLMRKISMTDDATALFVHELIPFMKAADDYSALDKLNELAGRLYIPKPRGVRKGTNPKQDISDYSQKFMAIIQKLIRHADTPSDALLSEIEELMDRHIGESVNMKRRAKKHLLTQTELDFCHAKDES